MFQCPIEFEKLLFVLHKLCGSFLFSFSREEVPIFVEVQQSFQTRTFLLRYIAARGGAFWHDRTLRTRKNV